MFITQGALREIGRHIWTAPEQEVLGFLLGEHVQSSHTGARHLLVTSTTQSSYVLAEDGAEQIGDDALHAAYLEARRRKLVLLGWYHSAPFVWPEPDPRDLRSHAVHFTEPWQVGIVVAPTGERPTGGVFRAGAGGDLRSPFLPFYEVVDEGGVLPDGRKRTVTPWKNYSTDDVTERGTQLAVVRPRMATGAIPVLIPKARPAEKRSGLRKTAAPGSRMSARQRRERRKRMAIAAVTGAAVLGALASALILLPQ
ncbi:MAG: hypothetical protein WKG32_10955 [Gemmatimonadaceae bacterium]